MIGSQCEVLDTSIHIRFTPSSFPRCVAAAALPGDASGEPAVASNSQTPFSLPAHPSPLGPGRPSCVRRA